MIEIIEINNKTIIMLYYSYVIIPFNITMIVEKNQQLILKKSDLGSTPTG